MDTMASGRVGIETEPLASPVQTLDGIAGRPVSNTRRALRRFFQQRLAVIGLIITGFLVGVALFAPLIAPTSIEAANLMSANQFPSAAYPSELMPSVVTC
jgi:ABC-type dipeptide/oligopeptide/nickel transport system permease subunit